MEKLAEILHELIGAVHGNKGIAPDRAAELHALADDVAAELPRGDAVPAGLAVDVTDPAAPAVPADGAAAA